MRIALCLEDDDLRGWIMEELLLVTWVADQPTFVTVPDPGELPAETSLLIADGDRLASVPPVPVIAIGTDPGLAGVAVLTAKLTSRELKQALRAALPRRTAESAQG